MEFSDVVRHRRMVRSFDPTPVPNDVLHRILDHARRGPSAGFTQGTEFLVLSGPDETQRYWEATLGDDDADDADDADDSWAGRLRQAPALVLVLSNKDAYLDRYAEADKGWTDRDEQRWWVPYWDVDAGMAAMLLLLGAVDEGLGALFFGIDGPWEPIGDDFGIPERYRCIGLVALGWPAGDDVPSGSAVTRRRRPLDEIVHRGRW